MKTLLLAAVAVASLSAAAQAQDMSAPAAAPMQDPAAAAYGAPTQDPAAGTYGAPAPAGPTADATPVAATTTDRAPDGSPAFGFEPYVGVLGGWHSFDRDSEFGAPGRRGKMDGALISGIAGVNVPLGPVFVGAEGNATKGFKDIDWEYGVKGRVGVRAGDTGMVYLSGGYQWVNGKGKRGYPDKSDWMYGAGVEVGPKDIGLAGLTGNSGVRLRLQADTYDFHSIRPMAGLVFHL